MKWYWWTLIFLGVVVLVMVYRRNTSSGVNNPGIFGFGGSRTYSPMEAYNIARQKIANQQP